MITIISNLALKYLFYNDAGENPLILEAAISRGLAVTFTHSQVTSKVNSFLTQNNKTKHISQTVELILSIIYSTLINSVHLRRMVN